MKCDGNEHGATRVKKKKGKSWPVSVEYNGISFEFYASNDDFYHSTWIKRAPTNIQETFCDRWAFKLQAFRNQVGWHHQCLDPCKGNKSFTFQMPNWAITKLYNRSSWNAKIISIPNWWEQQSVPHVAFSIRFALSLLTGWWEEETSGFLCKRREHRLTDNLPQKIFSWTLWKLFIFCRKLSNDLTGTSVLFSWDLFWTIDAVCM